MSAADAFISVQEYRKRQPLNRTGPDVQDTGRNEDWVVACEVIAMTLVSDRRFHNETRGLVRALRQEFLATGRVRTRVPMLARTVRRWLLARPDIVPQWCGRPVDYPQQRIDDVVRLLLAHYRGDIVGGCIVTDANGKEPKHVELPYYEDVAVDKVEVETNKPHKEGQQIMKMNVKAVINTGRASLDEHAADVVNAKLDAETVITPYARKIAEALATGKKFEGPVPVIGRITDHTAELRAAINFLEHVAGEEVDSCAATELLLTPVSELSKCREYRVVFELI